MLFLSHGYDFILLILLWFWHECTFTPCLSRVKFFAVFWLKKTLIQAIISDQTTCIIPVYWPIFYFLSLPPPHFLFFIFPPNLHLPPYSSPPSHLSLYSYPSFSLFIHPASPSTSCADGGLLTPQITPSSSTSSSHINPLLHDSSSAACSPPWPTTSITLRGENKNHHSSYLPPFWIDLSISTSAPLRLFYLSTCLTLLVALLSL